MLVWPGKMMIKHEIPLPIGSMVLVYIYILTNIGGILMVHVTIYSIHGSYGLCTLVTNR